MFKNEEVQELFEVTNDEKLFIERDLMLTNGEVVRPDRVTVEGTKAKIIDFKTGEKQKKHVKQLNQYANAMMSMGYNEVKSYILYTDSKEVEKV